MIRDLRPHREAAKRKAESLSLEEKLTVLCGSSKEMESIGLPRFVVGGEAAHGVQARHDQSFDVGEPVYTTVFPNPIGMSATWDKELIRQAGEVTGTEARSLFNEDRHRSLVMWAPTVDMERDPRWGRNEEAYGEDPYLTSRMAGSYILGMAGEDPDYVRCGATLKHFFANNVEQDRSLSDSIIPGHLKENYYLKVFNEIIDYAQPLAVMTSYNFVNGEACTFSSELTNIVDRLTHVTCDGGALSLSVTMQKSAADFPEAVAKAIKAGVDNFPDDAVTIRDAARKALDLGLLTEEELDKAVTNKLTAYSILGLLKPDKAPFKKTDGYDMSAVDTKNARMLSRSVSAESIVMLKNDGLCPLEKGAGVKLVGPFADRCPLDWYGGINGTQVTSADGLKAVFDAGSAESLMPYVRIRLEDGSYAGIDRNDNNKAVSTGLDNAEVFRLMLWDDCRVTLRATSVNKLLTTRKPDSKIINSEEAADSFELFATADEAFSWFANEAFILQDERGETVRTDEEHALFFYEDARIKGMGNVDGRIKLRFETVRGLDELIRGCGIEKDDTLIACFGLHPIVNCKEERDRTSIELPPFQRAVLSKLTEFSEHIVLLLCANAPLAVAKEHQAKEIRSIFWVPFGSEEYGNAVADVLTGDVSPSGRLPQTWYSSDLQLASIDDYDIEKSGMTYLYMKDKPLYRFGYGLSYTEFSQELVEVYSGEDVTGEAKPSAGDGGRSVAVRVKNIGGRTADEVVQVYVNSEGAYRLYDDELPQGFSLCGFERVRGLEPGAQTTVNVSISA